MAYEHKLQAKLSLVAYVKRHKPTVEENLTADMAIEQAGQTTGGAA